MKKMIHHIRRQPEEVRRSILHVFIMVCALVLLLLWIYSLGATFSNPDNQVKVTEDMKPFSALKDDMVNGYNSISQPSSNSDSDLKTQEDNL